MNGAEVELFPALIEMKSAPFRKVFHSQFPRNKIFPCQLSRLGDEGGEEIIKRTFIVIMRARLFVRLKGTFLVPLKSFYDGKNC